MENEKKGDRWFFFSQRLMKSRRKAAFNSGALFKRSFCILSDGTIAEYNDSNDSNVPRGRFKDFKYLGKGKHSHCFPERVFKEQVSRKRLRKKK